MDWKVLFSKKPLFGNYTQSVTDALHIADKKPTSLRFRVDTLSASGGSPATVNVYVEQALENSDNSYVTTSGGAATITVEALAATTISSETQVATLALDGNWMRLRFEINGAVSVPALQAEICY